MGLGKTVQIASFLGALFYSELTNLALIVVPKSLMSHWRKECLKW
jgi:DNA excision repair protein ERCC-6